MAHAAGGRPSYDPRPTLSREEVRQIYDPLAAADTNAGQDSESGYGGRPRPPDLPSVCIRAG